MHFAAKTLTIPIPFERLLNKVVAIVDREDAQTRQLLEHLEAGRFEVEVADRHERDVSEDADVGAYIALIDGDRRERAQQLARTVRAICFKTPLWALADSRRAFNRVPGFSYEVQGVLQDRVEGRIEFQTYVVRE